MTGFVPDFAAVHSPVAEEYDGSSLRMFKDCHAGDRCFILGNGPSLSTTDLSPLADEVTFGANGIFYMTWECGFTPTYYVVEDNHVFEDNLPRVTSVEAAARFFPSRYQPIVEPGPTTHFLPTDWSFYWGGSEWYERPRFSHDVSSVIYVGQSVTFLSLQLASYMGFREIYLIGVDFDYQIPPDATVEGLTVVSVADDPNHFHPDYFGKGKKWHLPKLENVGESLECAREAIEEVGSFVYNATLGGKLEIFPRVDYWELVGKPPTPEVNTAANYLLSRALRRAVDNGIRSVTVDAKLDGTVTSAVVAASPLEVTDDSGESLIVRRDIEAATDRRTLVVSGSNDESPVDWLPSFLVHLILTERSAFWTRGMLELSPDGESLLVPALGRAAQLGSDPHRALGVQGVGSLEDSRQTRWILGRGLSIDQILDLVREILAFDLSFGVIDGYVYVQSRWKPSEQPAELLSLRLDRNTREGSAVGRRA